MANKQLADDLRAARAVIEKPEAWTKGDLARNAFGMGVWPYATAAVCFCALGAIDKAVRQGGANSVRTIEASRALLRAIGAGSVDRFNDAPTTTHADILNLFDRAIAAAEA